MATRRTLARRALLPTLLVMIMIVQSAMSQILDRTKPPAAGPEPAATFPKYTDRTLSNGLKVLVVENRKLPIVSLSLVVRAGSALDDGTAGLADMTATVMMKGTTSRTATEIAEEIDFLGASLSTGAGWDACSVSASTLTKHLDTVLALFADIVLHPTFPAEEVKRQQALQIADLKQMKADGGYLASTRAAQVLYPGHPYGRTVTEESVGSMTAEQCVKFHATNFSPKNAFVVVAGDIGADEIAAKLEKLFSGWVTPPPSPRPAPAMPALNSTRVHVVQKPGAVQSSLRVAHEGVARSNPDFLALDALNTMFGGYFNSRLNATLRESRGYTYGVGSRFDGRMLGGTFSIGCDVRTSVTDSAITDILAELKKIVTEPIPEDELTMMKNYVAGKFPLSIETPQQVASQLQNIELFGLPRDYYETLGRNVRALTSPQLHALAQKYLHPDRLAIIVAGNAKAVQKTLEQFGPVDVVDADGKEMK